MALTDAAVKAAGKRDRAYKVADAGGLYLFVSAAGGRSWRMKYRFGGKERLLTFGPYPEISISKARARRDEARSAIRDGVDPASAKREARQTVRTEALRGITFEEMARRWHGLQAPRWAPIHAADVITSLERDVFPALGDTPIVALDTPTILAALRKVEDRGAIETAKRLRQRISAVFVFGISEGICAADPAAVAGKALRPLPAKRKQPSLTEVEDARAVLIAAEASGASPVTKLASRLLALTVVRPAVVRGAAWSEFEGIDWEDTRYGPDLPIWRVPAGRMKLATDKKGDGEAYDFVVPLPAQAVGVLRAIRRLTGRGKLAFPGQRHSHRPLSENAIGYLYNRVGFHGRHVPHGWRASFSTTMKARARRDKRYEDLETIELMLAHEPENKVAAAYDRHMHMERRRELAQEWADLISVGLAEPGHLLEGPRR